MTTIKRQLDDLASTLAAYERHSSCAEIAAALDCSNAEMAGILRAEREQEAGEPGYMVHPAQSLIEALGSVIDASLDEDGFRFIAPARVLCAAIQRGF